MNKKYWLFVGRWQPFHLGHYRLIKKKLDEGKNVLIACRDTEVGEKDPYSFKERRELIKRYLKKEIEDGKVQIILIPDIEGIAYGRDVGYAVEQIRLNAETETISGTKIRNHEN